MYVIHVVWDAFVDLITKYGIKYINKQEYRGRNRNSRAYGGEWLVSVSWCTVGHYSSVYNNILHTYNFIFTIVYIYL